MTRAGLALTSISSPGLNGLGRLVALVAGFLTSLNLTRSGLPGGLSGYELAPLLRGLPGLGDALLAALTGHGQGEDRRRNCAAGFDAHLTKPADPDALDALFVRGPKTG